MPATLRNMFRLAACAAALALATGCAVDEDDDDDSSRDASQISDAAAGQPCGAELTCAAGTVCVVDPVERECLGSEEGLACPEGTEPAQCGGAGLPCCCGPDQPSTARCVDAAACSDTPSCDCLDAVCPVDRVCETHDDPSGAYFMCAVVQPG